MLRYCPKYIKYLEFQLSYRLLIHNSFVNHEKSLFVDPGASKEQRLLKGEQEENEKQIGKHWPLLA